MVSDQQIAPGVMLVAALRDQLPVARATKFEFILDLATARAIPPGRNAHLSIRRKRL